MAGFENDVLLATNMNFDPAAAKPHLGIINAAGKIPIGTGNTSPTPEILAGKLVSPDGSLTIGYSTPNITLQVTGGHAIDTINGDVGSISGATVTIYTNHATRNFNAGQTVEFINSGTISTLQITDASSNTLIGNNCGNFLVVTSGSQNTGVGAAVLDGFTSGSFNTGIGVSALTSLSTGQSNTGIGQQSLANVLTGQFNTALGLLSGSGYIGAESYNICIGNIGVAAESNVMRLGYTGLNPTNTTFIYGITGNTVSNPQLVTINSSTGQLGVTTGGLFTWTDEAISFNALSGNGYFVTATATATLPAAPAQGNTIAFAVDSLAGILTITANTGQKIRIGSTLSTSAGTATSNADGDSVTLVYRSSDTTWIATSVIGTWTLST